MQGLIMILVKSLVALVLALINAITGGISPIPQKYFDYVKYAMIGTPIFIALLALAEIIAIHQKATGFVLGFGIVLSLISTALFAIINEVKRHFPHDAATTHLLISKYNDPQLLGRRAYTLASVAMVVTLVPMAYLAIPAAFTSDGGKILCLLWLAVVVFWIWGQVSRKDPLTVPRTLYISSILLLCIGLFSLIGDKILPVGLDRYSKAAFDALDTELNRKSAEMELAGRQTRFRVAKKSYLYEGAIVDGKVTGLKYSTYMDTEGNTVNRTVEAGEALDLVDTKVQSFAGGNTVTHDFYRVVLGDDLGETALADKAYFIDASRVERFESVDNSPKSRAMEPAKPPTKTANKTTFPANFGSMIEVCSGKKTCTLSVTGRINYSGGDASRWADADSTANPAAGDSTAPNIPFGVLVYKVGDSGSWAQLGSKKTIQTGGKSVYVALNDSGFNDNQGNYIITEE